MIIAKLGLIVLNLLLQAFCILLQRYNLCAQSKPNAFISFFVYYFTTLVFALSLHDCIGSHDSGNHFTANQQLRVFRVNALLLTEEDVAVFVFNSDEVFDEINRFEDRILLAL